MVGAARHQHFKGNMKFFFRWYMERKREGRRLIVVVCYDQDARSGLSHADCWYMAPGNILVGVYILRKLHLCMIGRTMLIARVADVMNLAILTIVLVHSCKTLTRMRVRQC
eukprot:12262081-Karenia_brevis.AAC.1